MLTLIGSDSGVAMLFRQVINEDLGCASYLVGDLESGQAAVVDPQWDITPYLDAARSSGVRIGHIIETHTHADHVSGRGRLHEATGDFGCQHEVALTERNGDVGVRDISVAFGDERFTGQMIEYVEHGKIEDVPRPQLLLDHLVADGVEWHGGSVRLAGGGKLRLFACAAKPCRGCRALRDQPQGERLR